MALRLVSVTDVFTDEAHLDHCGLVIISDRVDSEDRELPIITVPRSRTKVTSDDEEESYLFWTGSVKKVEHHTVDHEFGFICFHFNKEDESSTTRCFIIMNGAETHSFLSFIPNMLRPEIPSSLISKTAMLKMKKSNGYFRNNDYTLTAKSAQKYKSYISPEAYYQDFLKLYYNFFKRTQAPKEEFKQLMSSDTNLPKVLKAMGGKYSILETGFFEFIKLHKCRNRNCNGFATTKCSGCKNVRYCDAECQEMDFNKHSKLCPSLKQEKERGLYIGTILQREMKTRNVSEQDVKLLSFESFLSILLSKIFHLFSDILCVEDYPQTAARVKNEIRKRGLADGPIDLEKLRALTTDRIETVDIFTFQGQIEKHLNGDKFLTKCLKLARAEEISAKHRELVTVPDFERGFFSAPHKLFLFALDLIAWPCLVLWLMFLYRPSDLDWIPGVDRFWGVSIIQMFVKSKKKRDFTLYVLLHYSVYFHLITWLWVKNNALGWISCILYCVLTIIYTI